MRGSTDRYIPYIAGAYLRRKENRTEEKIKSCDCSGRKILDTLKLIKKPPFLLETKVNLTSEFRSCY